MKNTKRVFCAGIVAALAQPGLTQATDSPVSGPPYTEEQLYTERHSAAASSVETMNFVVGRLAMRELVTAVRGQGSDTVADLIGAGDNKERCARAVGIVDAGRLDVIPGFPTYEAISEVVVILQSMQAMK